MFYVVSTSTILVPETGNWSGAIASSGLFTGAPFSGELVMRLVEKDLVELIFPKIIKVDTFLVFIIEE